MTQNNTKSRRIVLKTIPAVLLVLALGVCFFRVYLLFRQIDSITGLYNFGAEKYRDIFNILTFSLFAASLLSCFAARRYAYPRPVKNEAITVAFAATMCGLMQLTIFVANIYGVVKGTRQLDGLLAVESLLCLPSSGYFFYICSHGAKLDSADKPVYNFLPLFPALYVVVRTITLFINTSTQINTSQRSFVLLTMICIMMFFVTEAELATPALFHRDAAAEQKALNRISAKYYALGLAVAVLCMIVIISYALAQAYGFYGKTHLLYSVMDIMFGLYAMIRVFTI